MSETFRVPQDVLDDYQEHEENPTLLSEMTQANYQIALGFARGDYERTGKSEARLRVSRHDVDSSPTELTEEMRGMVEELYRLAHALPDEATDHERRTGSGLLIATHRVPTQGEFVFDEVRTYHKDRSEGQLLHMWVVVRRPDDIAQLGDQTTLIN